MFKELSNLERVTVVQKVLLGEPVDFTGFTKEDKELLVAYVNQAKEFLNQEGVSEADKDKFVSDSDVVSLQADLDAIESQLDGATGLERASLMTKYNNALFALNNAKDSLAHFGYYKVAPTVGGAVRGIGSVAKFTSETINFVTDVLANAIKSTTTVVANGVDVLANGAGNAVETGIKKVNVMMSEELRKEIEAKSKEEAESCYYREGIDPTIEVMPQ